MMIFPLDPGVRIYYFINVKITGMAKTAGAAVGITARDVLFVGAPGKSWNRYMNVIDQNIRLPNGLQTVVTVGNFDGLHRGHTRLIARTVAAARARAVAAAVVTFEPHTRSVVYPELSTKLLTTFDEKAYFMRKMGIDYVFRVNFDENFRAMTQEEFVEKVLVYSLHAVGWVMGEGHHVGRNLGEVKKNLQFVCGKYYINMFREPLETAGGAVISSTRIRGLVSDGRVSDAVALLGHPYLIAAERVAGVKVATHLGFPTLNFKRPDAQKVIPPAGVYAAEIEIGGQGCGGVGGADVGGIGGRGDGGGGAYGLSVGDSGNVGNGGVNGKSAEINGGDERVGAACGKKLTGALYFGDCPTYEGRETHFEFHALGYNGRNDITEPKIGETVHLWLHKYIRPDAAFNSENALRDQIAKDIDSIKKYFSEETR